MKICPECSLELPDGIPTCPDCEIPMIDPEEMIEECQMESNEQRYVLLRSVPSRLYATMLEEALSNEGIPAVVQSEDIGIMLGNYGTAPFPPVQVLVPACFRHRANRIAFRIAGDL